MTISDGISIFLVVACIGLLGYLAWSAIHPRQDDFSIPEFDQLEDQSPKPPEVGEWRSPAVKPSRIGVYKTRFQNSHETNITQRMWWNNKDWCELDNHIPARIQHREWTES